MKKNLSISRKIILFLLSFIMIINLFIMGISFQIKNIATDTLCTPTVSEAICDKIIVIVKENLGINTDKFQNIEQAITENDYIKEITLKYIEAIIEQLNNGNTEFTFNVEITAQITDLIKAIVNSFKESTNSSLLNKVIDSFSEQILSQAKSVENTINEYITENANKYASQYDTYIKIYSILISTWFKALLIGIVIVLSILCMIVTKSIRTTLLNFGGCSLFAGLTYISIFFNFVSNIFQAISQQYVGTTLHLSHTYFIKSGIIMIIAGILGIVAGMLVRKKLKNKF